ncbi:MULTISPECIES: alpha/beta fold hydrolase [Streptomyces]|uniref:Alpha/beta hydrolase n=1 Tax=Streptomyces cadmiisoli TaxID=2184053 RepID=A0A2Z4JBL1_9ACTN|nr:MULTISPECIES: alpha/beta hydrolase [Streptomyces]AWW41743.1 alpha/beta hydrolase [Streptomyces cadmiisoli]
MSTTNYPSLRGFEHEYADVNGTRLHYVIGGQGDDLMVLLPGWPRTWWQFRKLMPKLAERFRVVAVDIRGMGDSDKPGCGYDKKNMARDIYELVRSLGYSKAHICGEDIGGMVAYSYAVNHPEATDKLALWETIHPNEGFYGIPMLPQPAQDGLQWWLAFNMVKDLPEAVLTGRFRTVQDWIIEHYSGSPESYTEEDRAIYAAAYNTSDAIRAGNAWYQEWHQDMVDDKEYPETPITVPTLFLAGKSAPLIFPMIEKKAADIRTVELAGAGHFLSDERPDDLLAVLEDFFV